MNMIPHTTQGIYRFSVSTFFFIQGLVFASWASRIPDIKSALHLNEAELGSVLFAIPVGQLSAMALSGYLVTRFGSRKILLFAAIFYPIVLVSLGTVVSVLQLILTLYFFGIAANMCNISVNTQGVGVERLYHHSIMASFHGLWSLAGFIGGLIGSLMMGFKVSPLLHFCVVFLLTFCLLLITRKSILPRDTGFHQSKELKQPKKKKIFVYPDRYIFLLGGIAFGSMVCEGTMFDWSGVYFESIIKPQKELIGAGYIAFMSTMALGRFLSDKFVTRFGYVFVLRISGILIASGLLLSVCLPYFLLAVIGFFLVGFGTSSVVPLCYSLAGKSKKMQPGIALATVSTIGFLGFLLGPPLIGFVAQVLSLRYSFALIACIGLITVFLAPKLRTAE